MNKIPRKTITRALLYIRILENLIKEKRYLISSKEIASMAGFTDVQVRKDISAIGRVGKPRIGYKTKELRDTLEDFVLQKNTVRVVLFGVGNLGKAIIRYPGFHKGKIKLAAAFDKAAAQVGRKINGLTIYSIKKAPEIIKATKAHIGIIAVPKESAQEVADVMVMSGLRGIVNFSPTTITVPKNVMVKDIDLSIEFLSLFCGTQI